MLSEAIEKRILVAEDDPLVLELITTRLEIAGFRTFYARDGFEALAKLAELRPSAMVLDINMPRLDGFGVLKEMKRMAAVRNTPTLVLTARNQPDDVKTAIGLGARDFMTKPFHHNLLITRVARLLRKPGEPGGETPAAVRPNDANALFL